MLNYFKPVFLPDGSVLSCDSVVLNCFLNPKYKNEFESYLRRPDLVHLEYNSRPCLSSFKFKYFFEFKYPESSMRVKYIFNGKDFSQDILKVEFDFNPNKVCSSDLFWSDFRELISCMEEVKLSRCDIALDVKYDRSNCFMRKNDQRLYSARSFRSLQDHTEYLGKHNNLGFVKVYNKKIESKLDYDLTRIEVTCNSAESYLKYFPEVYFLEDMQLDFDMVSKLTDTDLYILRAEMILRANGLDDGLVLFNSLGRKEKQKLKAVFCPESAAFSVPGPCYVRSVFNMIKDNFLK